MVRPCSRRRIRPQPYYGKGHVKKLLCIMILAGRLQICSHGAYSVFSLLSRLIGLCTDFDIRSLTAFTARAGPPISGSLFHTMPPHGRRRAETLFSFLFLLSLLLSTASAASAVLGIDLGTEYIKAALVKPGIPLEIVLTKDSKRKEAAAVAFKPLKSKASTSAGIFPERAYGGDAVALSARFPGDVYSNLKPLLGLTTSSSHQVEDYRSWHPGTNIVGSKERNTVAFVSESFTQEEEPFMVEELLAMELQNIRGNAEAFAGKGSVIRDVVITIPAFYTAEEKRAIEVAAELAGLRTLALVSDGLSVGLNYATSRTFPVPGDGVKPEYHLVYDMGAGSTTATVLRFQGKVVKDVGKFNKTIQDVQVMGVGWDKSLGGDSLNALILEDMVTKFAESERMKALNTGIEHIKSHGRTMAKLWKEAERLRQVLSANSETSSSFEGLYHEDVSFKYRLSRSDFENLAADYSKRVSNPVTEALSMAKLGLADIESVILHGGAVRTPFVQKELETVVGSGEKIRTNVNSDEAAVFGAAFKAAGISPSFRVKEIRANDIAVHHAGLSWILEGKEKVQKLFLPSSQVGAEKQVPIKTTEDFSFELHQHVVDGDSKTRGIPVSRVQTQNLTASVKELTEKYGCSVADISTTFSIRLSVTDGLPEVSRGSVSCEAVDTTKKGVVDNVKGLFGFGSKKGDQVPLSDDTDALLEDEATDHTTTSTSVSDTSSASKSIVTPSTSKGTEKPEEIKKKTQVIPVNFTSNVTGLPQLSAAELRRIKDRMDAFDASDRSRRLREEALNTLEGYTYKVRDLIEDEGFGSVSTKEQRAEIEGKAKSASEWLYGDGADATRDTFMSRLKELRDLVDPIQKRKDEAINRPGQIQMLRDLLEETKTSLKMVEAQSERVASEEAAASFSSAAEAKSTTTSSSTTDDEFADLEDETSTTPTASTSATPVTAKPSYTAEELSDLTKVHESVQKWLDEKVAEQDKLSPTDDPVISTSDLAAKSKELKNLVVDLLQKQMQAYGKSKSSSKSKISKTKTTKRKTKESKSSKTVVTEIPIGTDRSLDDDKTKASGKGKVKDEL